VYAKPGLPRGLQRVAILDCYVEFEKDWEQDYTGAESVLEGRVTDKDVERIKKDLAASSRGCSATNCRRRRGYQVVDVAAPTY